MQRYKQCRHERSINCGLTKDSLEIRDIAAEPENPIEYALASLQSDQGS